MEYDDIKIILADQFSYVDHLSPEIKDIIADYTGNMYERLNRLLRKQSPLGEYEGIVNKLDEVFNGIPVTNKPIIVYRGINAKEFVPELMSYISTSYDIDIAYDNAGSSCCILRITIPAGSKILPIENISELHQEKEILLPRIGKLLVTNYHYENEVMIYDIIYLPPDCVELTQGIISEEIREQLDIGDWSNRLVNLIIADDMELFGDMATSVAVLIESYFKDSNIPQGAIDNAIDRLNILYPSDN